VSDQFGNTVDKEVWVPARAKAWLDGTGVGRAKFDYVYQTPKASMEYAIAYADGNVDDEGTFTTEGDARRRVMAIRRELEVYGIPEDLWPIVMEREVSITRSSWKPLNV
jgi:hypothetical protein